MKKRISIILLTLLAATISAQSIKSMEFNNQEITDILLVLAESSGVSIIPDETVSGKASFYFSESSIETALSNFLATYKYYYEKDDNIIRVSKIKISYNQKDALVSLKADGVPVEQILRALSKKIGKTILFDTMPSSQISVDIENLPVMDVLKICTKKLPDYKIESEDSYYYVKKDVPEKENKKTIKIDECLTREGDYYTINLEKGRFLEVVAKLFNLEEKEYSLFVQSDTQLNNLYFAEKDFDTMLGLILEQGNADCIEKNGIYYIIDLQKKGINAKLKPTEIIHLTWIQAQDVPSLIPTELTSSTSLKIDKTTNTILLTGSEQEITPLKQFIKMIDIPMGGTKYKRIDIKYLDAKDIITLVPQKMIQNQPVIIPNTNSILACGTEETIDTLEEFISSIDRKKSGIPIKLKYIQAETLIKNLPPSISKETIVDSGYPNLLFYTGTEENKQLFMNELSMIDKPQPQIKYQLLVIQYSKLNSSSVNPPTFTVNKYTGKNSEDTSNFLYAGDINNLKDAPSATENYLFSGDLTNLMSLNFDVVDHFGYQFAVKLNNQIGNSTADILTDTTLTALSGQEVKFQNTDTYRYIEYEYDTTSSTTTRTGSTQQITSGLIVSLNGWISGDNMITMNVNATVSKQNSESSTTTSSVTALPSTSERVVTTQVRSSSGEPIVISGLIKEDVSENESKTPILGSIPLLGRLFTHKTTSKEKTEIVIYIVPHLIQESEGSQSDSLNIERYYKTLVSQ